MRQVWEAPGPRQVHSNSLCSRFPGPIYCCVWGSWSPFNDYLTLLPTNPPTGPAQTQPLTVTFCTEWVSLAFIPRPSPPFLPKETVELQVPCLLVKQVGNWLYGDSPHQAL